MYPGGAAGRVPVLKLGEVLLVTIQGDLHDSTAEQLQQDLSETIARSGATGASSTSPGWRSSTPSSAGCWPRSPPRRPCSPRGPWWPDMRPAVAITLVELGLTLPGLRTALDAQAAMALLEQPVVRSHAGGMRRERA
ncbi:Anti-anti-sigma factor OS=Streptomyces fumanus OX=67302 GN=GCM10018772_54500 PE=4 SV=1 [Streptomyces fumanus]